MNLTQKESELLKDLKGQEKLCVDKYTRHSSAASDAQLKNMFSQIAQTEQQHLDTLMQIEKGSAPQMQQGSSQNQQGSSNRQNTASSSFTATYGMGDNKDKQNDSYLCSDVLSSEKHASGLYDTCIFEFKDEQVRTALNHIQKEEQNHGKMIYDYMQTNNMYS